MIPDKEISFDSNADFGSAAMKAQFVPHQGFDDVTAPLCGSSQTHLGTLMPSGGGHIINAPHQRHSPKIFLRQVLAVRFGEPALQRGRDTERRLWADLVDTPPQDQ